jgi:D-tyrosyl-tRNA(Tyr) deacylase
LRALLQRVSRASVEADGQTVGAIGPGLLVLLGVRRGDTQAEADWLARKTAELRIFNGEAFAGAAGKFDRSLLDVGGAVLVVSQFTLYGDARRGRRPDFTAAAAPAEADTLYQRYAQALVAAGVTEVATGRFGAMMQVSLFNDGPVTVLLEREAGG